MVDNEKKVILEAPIIIDTQGQRNKYVSAAKKISIPVEKQRDLLYMLATYVSSGTNMNGVTFLSEELLRAHNTIVHKAVDIEHNEENVIGHIYDCMYVYRDGTPFDPSDLLKDFADKLTTANKIPMDIVMAGVIYKMRFPEIAKEINEGLWKVSMEAYYEDYDVKIGEVIMDKQQASLFGYTDDLLGKMVKVKSAGTDYGPSMVSRVLRGITFSGVGITKNPANPESLVMETASVKDASTEDRIIEIPNNMKYFDLGTSSVNEKVKTEEVKDMSKKDENKLVELASDKWLEALSQALGSVTKEIDKFKELKTSEEGIKKEDAVLVINKTRKILSGFSGYLDIMSSLVNKSSGAVHDDNKDGDTMMIGMMMDPEDHYVLMEQFSGKKMKMVGEYKNKSEALKAMTQKMHNASATKEEGDATYYVGNVYDRYEDCTNKTMKELMEKHVNIMFEMDHEGNMVRMMGVQSGVPIGAAKEISTVINFNIMDETPMYTLPLNPEPLCVSFSNAVYEKPGTENPGSIVHEHWCLKFDQACPVIGATVKDPICLINVLNRTTKEKEDFNNFEGLSSLRGLNNMGDFEKSIDLLKSTIEKAKLVVKNFNKEVAEKWTRQFINDLPDSSFAVVEHDISKTNKNGRHLPHHGKGGGGSKNINLDLPHLRNALARANQVKAIGKTSTEELRRRAVSHLNRHRGALKTEASSKNTDPLLIEEIEALYKKINTELFGADLKEE